MNELTLDEQLVIACKDGDINEVGRLIKQGADIYFIFGQTENSLGAAAGNGHLPVVQYLVGLGVDVHFDDNRALLLAAFNGHLPVVQYLVKQGADIHTDDEAILRGAAYEGHTDVVEFLIEQGCNIDRAINHDGMLETEEKVKDWLKQYRNSRDLSNKLQSELNGKDLVKRIEACRSASKPKNGRGMKM